MMNKKHIIRTLEEMIKEPDAYNYPEDFCSKCIIIIKEMKMTKPNKRSVLVTITSETYGSPTEVKL